MAVTLTPYIFFKGDAKEAMEFYKDVFGGELTTQTYEQANQPGSELTGDKLMHADLHDGLIRIFGSDTDQASEAAKKVTLSINGEAEDETKLSEVFEKLSQGGEVRSPLKKEFWGDTFGMVTDKYKVDWMVNIAGAKE